MYDTLVTVSNDSVLVQLSHVWCLDIKSLNEQNLPNSLDAISRKQPLSLSLSLFLSLSLSLSLALS